MLTNHGARVASLTALLALAPLACIGEPTEDPEVAAIAQALEEENGGLTMTDEAPAFGAPELANAAAEPEEAIADPYLDDVEVQGLQQLPDAVVFHALVLWGQFPVNLENTEPRVWSGALHVNRGAVLVDKAVAFESDTDHLLPRPDAQTVAFESVTLPHHDGLRLTIIDPTPLAGEPLVVRYAGADGLVVSLPIETLVHGPVTRVVDELGNRVVAMAMAQPIDGCAHGMLGGHWRELAPGRGRFIGPVVNAEGDRIGHLRGIYGVRENDEQVFFGKYIDAEGKFMGLFKGHYGDEKFEGQWLHFAGDVGKLGGQYRETLPGPEQGGHFLGGWAETSCAPAPQP
ncbi:MAG: hypothetical protein HY908_12315 [Myxococcales bacterium]|nr:hypothetical protein [Myxococcales bacterium]